MRLVVAGCETGGHLFPGVAIAREVLRRWPESRVLFVAQKRGVNAEVIREEGFEFQPLEVLPFVGRGVREMVRAGIRLPEAIWCSLRILRRFSPDAVLGVGGYSSGPVVLAARMRRLPIFLQEQNSYPGLTNRLLAPFADKIFIAYPKARNYLPEDVTLLTGNPVRQEIGEEVNVGAARAALGLDPGRFTVLVFGGSQGAQSLNQGMVEASSELASRRDELQVVHQTGEEGVAVVEAAYRQAGIAARVVPFIRRMSLAYAAADLVVCRAGALTLAELAVAGKPAILVPYPFAARNHQWRNAQAVAEAGAAVLVEDWEAKRGRKLAEVILRLLDEPETLADMAEKSRGLARPQAAERIVDYIKGFLTPSGL